MLTKDRKTYPCRFVTPETKFPDIENAAGGSSPTVELPPPCDTKFPEYYYRINQVCL
jgi:hypothetical protein